ncbi:transmembrane protein 53-like lethal (2) k09913 isoform X2 [Leptinotarsa decemlineata]
MRNLSSLEITKNISLLSDDKKTSKVINLKMDVPQEKPLVVMLSWLMAKKKHVHKYADIYLKHGFDVLNISLSPWQLLWPVKGSQVVAKDLLKFLDLNTTYSPLILHGFSVGAYLWGEVMVNIAADRDRYDHIVDRIAGQIWDSAADITEISVGLPVSVFPKNTVLQNALKQYVIYHMKAFDKVATVHYIRSSQMFHTNLVRAPAQIFISKTDPIGTEESNMRVRESWENMGIQISWKCFDKSPHVGHFRIHPKEYTAVLNSFLASLNIPQKTSRIERQEEKIKAKL